MAARALTRSGDISPGYFTWLASDGWGKQSAVVNEIQEFAVGAITVELESKKIHGRDLVGCSGGSPIKSVLPKDTRICPPGGRILFLWDRL